ncbi:MAG: c-type cytochrome [Burkholderiales bacterium]|nr:c-type cytochrome [Burkholderiales bacterium]MDQ3196192.1 c-type cytochrome [Pseudomonadota bacterium]
MKHLSLLLALLGLAGCGEKPVTPLADARGDAERGKQLLWQYGCGACHSIPEVKGAFGNVGPPLEGMAERVYLAGFLPNTPENMVRWIRAPQAVDPLTAMPDLKVTEAHAHDMAAYLYRLK